MAFAQDVCVEKLCLTRFESPLPAVWQTAEMERLGSTEQVRLARIQRPLRREQFLVGHVLLRGALIETRREPAQIEVDGDGRPLIHAARPTYASIAHSANVVAVVIAGAPVGVDLEVVQPMRDPRAAAALLGLPAGHGDDSDSVLRAWVAAEARLKAGPRAGPQTWRCCWQGCQLAVAGMANPPLSGVLDVMTGIYNAVELRWEAV